MALMMLCACRADVMGAFTLPPPLRAVGWLATAVMATAAVGLVATSLAP